MPAAAADNHCLESESAFFYECPLHCEARVDRPLGEACRLHPARCRPRQEINAQVTLLWSESSRTSIMLETCCANHTSDGQQKLSSREKKNIQRTLIKLVDTMIIRKQHIYGASNEERHRISTHYHSELYKT